MALCKQVIKSIIKKIGYDNWKKLQKVPYKYNILAIERATIERALEIVEKLLARNRTRLYKEMKRKMKIRRPTKLQNLEILERVSKLE